MQEEQEEQEEQERLLRSLPPEAEAEVEAEAEEILLVSFRLDAMVTSCGTFRRLERRFYKHNTVEEVRAFLAAEVVNANANANDTDKVGGANSFVISTPYPVEVLRSRQRLGELAAVQVQAGSAGGSSSRSSSLVLLVR